MLAMAYQDLPDIDETAPIDDADISCLEEIRQVLIKHGRLDRFGISLLHSHFPIGEDEVLVESCDDVNRVLSMNVQPASVMSSSSLVPTSWRLNDAKITKGCYKACVVSGNTHKRGSHVTTGR